MITINALVSLREDAGLTQSELADRIGITRTAISKIENEHRRLELPTLLAWVEACGGSLALVNPLGDLNKAAVGAVRALDPTDSDLVRRIAEILPTLSQDQRDTLEVLVRSWSVKKV